MNTSEKFMRFAAECEFMAKLTRDRSNKTVWRQMAERWLRCAELLDRQSASSSYAYPQRRRERFTHRWVD